MEDGDGGFMLSFYAGRKVKGSEMSLVIAVKDLRPYRENYERLFYWYMSTFDPSKHKIQTFTFFL